MTAGKHPGTVEGGSILPQIGSRGKLDEDDKVRTYEYSRSTGAIQDLDDECC